MPPSGFAARPLPLVEIATGSVWRRLYRSTFPNPLGYGFGPSRFSDPEVSLGPPDRYAVVYFGNTIKVCFAEVILREHGLGHLGTFPIDWAELENWTCAEVRVKELLQVVDLRGDSLLKARIPTDVARAATHDLSQQWSRAFWLHDSSPDGIVYSSRLNGETNLALFDRALAKVGVTAKSRLVDCRSELAAIINDFDLAII